MTSPQDPRADADPSTAEPVDASRARAYWAANVRLLVILTAIWAACSFGAGIVFRDALDRFMLAGYPLGFWFAQQGSIFIFVALIFIYSWRMKKIEQAFDLDD